MLLRGLVPCEDICCLQSTSLFLHWFPAVVAWTQRWHHDVHIEEVISRDPELMAEWDNATLSQLVFYPMVPYLAWAVAYYAKVQCTPGQATAPIGQSRLGGSWDGALVTGITRVTGKSGPTRCPIPSRMGTGWPAGELLPQQTSSRCRGEPKCSVCCRFLSSPRRRSSTRATRRCTSTPRATPRQQ